MTIRNFGRMAAVSVLSAAVAALAPSANGHGGIPHATPVDRLIANLTQYIKDHPDDPEGYYRLGRVHTMALETKSNFVLAWNTQEGEAARPAEGSWAKSWGVPQDDGQLNIDELGTHLSQAIDSLSTAIHMKPDEARYRLTLACALEAGEPLMKESHLWALRPRKDCLTHPSTAHSNGWLNEIQERFEKISNDPLSLSILMMLLTSQGGIGEYRDVLVALAIKHADKPEYSTAIEKIRITDWQMQIDDQFFTAMCYALPSDGKVTSKPMWGEMEDWVAYEAAKDFVRVIESRKGDCSDTIRLRVAKEAIKACDELPPPGGITPLILDLERQSFKELVSQDAVNFDLDGSGRKQSWNWVTPDAGILVWDPERSGKITSGRQLFGSISWWVMFENGYQALDALDDNRDGELAGDELKGISVWFDRNSNGVSDEGEVQRIEDVGVAGLSCRATGTEMNCQSNLRGVRMTDGQVRASYDWIAERTTK